MHRFTFSTGGDFSGTEVEMLLRQYGIRVWGRELNHAGELAFLVKQAQAEWAEYVLCRAGVALTCQLLNPRNAEYRLRHEYQSMPRPWTKRGIGPHSFVDYVVDWLDRLVG
jgi:hypothetical protein